MCMLAERCRLQWVCLGACLLCDYVVRGGPKAAYGSRALVRPLQQSMTRIVGLAWLAATEVKAHRTRLPLHRQVSLETLSCGVCAAAGVCSGHALCQQQHRPPASTVTCGSPQAAVGGV